MERDERIIAHITRTLRRATDLPGEGYNNEDLSSNSDPGWCRVLVIGAGGLGCELLKCLALSGFIHVDVVDMDTIDLSNLNRQFLFREADIGKPKAVTAAEFVNTRCPWMRVVPHHGKIQDLPDDFYRQFHIIILGLDSIHARQWMNEMVSRIMYIAPDGDAVSVVATPLIDGGTEGFKGHSRVIQMGLTACFECTLDLFPPQIKVPICTLENIPRQPEHCVLYTMEVTWEKEWPFGRGVKIDGDDESHIMWISQRAARRAKEFNIPGDFTFQFTQGVTKNIIPALASTNAIIASQCVNEALKIVTGMSPAMNNYFTFNGGSETLGAFGTLQSLLPSPGCHVCQPKLVKCSKSWTPSELVAHALLPFLREQFDSPDLDAVSQLYARVNPGPGANSIEFFLLQSGLLAEKTRDLQGVAVYDTARDRLSRVTDEEGVAALLQQFQLQVDCKPGSRRVLLQWF